MRIALIGHNSFLACALRGRLETKDWTFLTRQSALQDSEELAKCDLIINCAFHPDLKISSYDPLKDIDRQIAYKIRDSKTHFIMLSSRLVYGPRTDNNIVLKETDAPDPQGFYAGAKYETEKALVDILGPERVTILRMGNIFGAEYGRPTFMGRALQTLIERNEIIFDMPSESVRDFRSAQSWAAVMLSVAENPHHGLYNLGAGFGISAQEVAETLIAARGAGEWVAKAEKPTGSFILDMTKTNIRFSLDPYSKDELLADLRTLVTPL